MHSDFLTVAHGNAVGGSQCRGLASCWQVVREVRDCGEVRAPSRCERLPEGGGTSCLKGWWISSVTTGSCSLSSQECHWCMTHLSGPPPHPIPQEHYSDSLGNQSDASGHLTSHRHWLKTLECLIYTHYLNQMTWIHKWQWRWIQSIVCHCHLVVAGKCKILVTCLLDVCLCVTDCVGDTFHVVVPECDSLHWCVTSVSLACLPLLTA